MLNVSMDRIIYERSASRRIMIFTILMNLNLYLCLVYIQFNQFSNYRLGDYYEFLLNPLVLLVCFIFFSSSIMAVLISDSSSKTIKRIGFGIVGILLLIFIYILYDSLTCHGELCGLGAVLVGPALLSVTLPYLAFYVIGHYSRKFKLNFSLILLWFSISVSAVLILLIAMFVQSHLNIY